MKSDTESYCEGCGAKRPRWMGGSHHCPDAAVEHPYDYFGNPLELEDEL